MRFLFKSLWGKTINRFIELEINKIKNNKIIGKSQSGKLYSTSALFCFFYSLKSAAKEILFYCAELTASNGVWLAYGTSRRSFQNYIIFRSHWPISIGDLWYCDLMRYFLLSRGICDGMTETDEFNEPLHLNRIESKIQ